VGDKLVVLGKNVRTVRASSSHSSHIPAVRPASSQPATKQPPSVHSLSINDDRVTAAAAETASISQTHTAGM